MSSSRPLRRSLALCALLLGMCSIVAARPATAPHATTYKNPVYKGDFPDPFVLKAGSTYYAYATNGNNENIQTLTSKDMVHWKPGKDAMPVTATWVGSNIWAPDVFRRADGTYIMYYTGGDTKYGRQCVGYAVSRSPAGPFRDPESAPLVCNVKLGGDIDPDVLQDGSNLYLYYKNDGNCCGLTDYLWGQRLSADGTKLEGKPVKLDKNDKSWEGQVIEAPVMWRHGKGYDLFFSANAYDSPSYAVGYASCRTPLGPCTDSPKNPVLQSGCNFAGPGGETLINDAKGHTWVYYHAWPADNIGYPNSQRMLLLDRVYWKNGQPVVHGPTCTAQPAPAVKG